MDIFLQDLGQRRLTALLRQRAGSLRNNMRGSRFGGGRPTPSDASGGRAKSPRLGLLGRLWARGAGGPPETAAAGVDAIRGEAYGFVGGFLGGSTGFWIPGLTLTAVGLPDPGIVLCGAGALMSGAGLAIPAYLVRRVIRPPVTAEEIEALRVSAEDELERAYLSLALDAARQPVAPEAEKGIRAALRALGEAIDQLPIVAGAHADVASLRAEAARMLAEAAREPDSVVAASRERRAEALERSADAAERSEALRRRAVALREEMQSQVESLHLGLTGFQTESGDVAGLAQLADSVRAVATEAASVSAARAELDAAIESPHRVAIAEGETVPLRNNAR